ncbi:MAG: hypothetical protein ABIL39_11520 [candidate division WOR-3 bacterium]
MAKWIHDDVLDAALNYIKNNATRISVCSQQPANYTEATSTYMLAIKTISSSDFTGPTNGDTSGRKITSNQHTGVNITNSGTATHVAISDSTNSKLLLVTTCTSQQLYAGNTVTIPAFDDEIADPT